MKGTNKWYSVLWNSDSTISIHYGQQLVAWLLEGDSLCSGSKVKTKYRSDTIEGVIVECRNRKSDFDQESDDEEANETEPSNLIQELNRSGVLQKIIQDILEDSSKLGPRRPIPGVDPVGFLRNGTLENLSEEDSEDSDIISALMSVNTGRGKSFSQLMLDRQHGHGKDGLNVMLEVIAAIKQIQKERRESQEDVHVQQVAAEFESGESQEDVSVTAKVGKTATAKKPQKVKKSTSKTATAKKPQKVKKSTKRRESQEDVHVQQVAAEFESGESQEDVSVTAKVGKTATAKKPQKVKKSTSKTATAKKPQKVKKSTKDTGIHQEHAIEKEVTGQCSQSSDDIEQFAGPKSKRKRSAKATDASGSRVSMVSEIAFRQTQSTNVMKQIENKISGEEMVCIEQLKITQDSHDAELRRISSELTKLRNRTTRGEQETKLAFTKFGCQLEAITKHFGIGAVAEEQQSPPPQPQSWSRPYHSPTHPQPQQRISESARTPLQQLQPQSQESSPELIRLQKIVEGKEVPSQVVRSLAHVLFTKQELTTSSVTGESGVQNQMRQVLDQESLIKIEEILKIKFGPSTKYHGLQVKVFVRRVVGQICREQRQRLRAPAPKAMFNATNAEISQPTTMLGSSIYASLDML
ncbi:uncharacterized protein [Amphiura filiformis]|uniref:uncharacterized protein isoform X1 n=1 Tax=Amphiura filiformis TaxID=82378 RepID=UPI003B21D397